jgi:hypothetical protein
MVLLIAVGVVVADILLQLLNLLSLMERPVVPQVVAMLLEVPKLLLEDIAIVLLVKHTGSVVEEVAAAAELDVLRLKAFKELR